MSTQMPLTTEQKADLIGLILNKLRFMSTAPRNQFQVPLKPFDEGDTFFSLCFKSDAELSQIAKLAGL